MKPPFFTPQRDVDALIKAFSAQRVSILEIGCNRGLTTKALAQAFPERTVVGYDIPRYSDSHPQRNEFVSQVELIGDQTKHLANVAIYTEPKNLDDLVYRFGGVFGGNFDCIFIDGDHTREGVLKDTKWSINYLRRHYGGIIAWHDFYDDAPAWCCVKEVVLEQTKLNNLGLSHDPSTWIAWSYVKPRSEP